MDNQETTKESGGYGKRPMWQWILIYVVVAAIVYGAIYYFVAKKNGGYSYPQPGQTTGSATKGY